MSLSSIRPAENPSTGFLFNSRLIKGKTWKLIHKFHTIIRQSLRLIARLNERRIKKSQEEEEEEQV